DLAESGHHPVTRDLPIFHPEPVCPVRRENVELHERAFVEQHLDPVAGRRLAGRAALVGGGGLGMERLVPALAVLVDLLLGDRRRLTLRCFDSFEAWSRAANGR